MAGNGREREREHLRLRDRAALAHAHGGGGETGAVPPDRGPGAGRGVGARLLGAAVLGWMLSFGAGRLAAQEIPSPYRYVEPRQSALVTGGYLFTDRGELDLGPESAPLVGVRYSIRLSGPFTAEAGVAYLPSSRTVFDTVGVDQPLREVGEADFGLALVDVALRFDLTGPRTYHGFQPFVMAGGGLAIEASGDDPVESEIAEPARFDFGTRFAGEVGAGVEWFATRHLALRADVRDVFWKLKTPPAFLRQSSEPVDIADDEWVQNFALSLGLAYHF
ncbi:MAG TPA: outer membrane beta-barrel protein [Longimicrobiales bacterium]